MRRTDLQKHAQAKIDDAVLLIGAGRWSSAYYLAGYSIELGLKACIARQISVDTIPDKAILKDVLTHHLATLLGLAGLRGEHKIAQDADPTFAANWAIVSEWSPDARYSGSTAFSAQFLIAAITDPDHGVLPWIKRFW